MRSDAHRTTCSAGSTSKDEGMRYELKPCPFCGGEAETCSHYFDDGDMTLWQVRCKERPYNVEHPCYTADSFISFTTEAEAVEAWNTRAAVTDEQFAIAVHNADVWRKERTCEMKVSPGTAWRTCSRCSAFVYYDAVTNATNVIQVRYCPNCGAKVVD